MAAYATTPAYTNAAQPIISQPELYFFKYSTSCSVFLHLVFQNVTSL